MGKIKWGTNCPAKEKHRLHAYFLRGCGDQAIGVHNPPLRPEFRSEYDEGQRAVRDGWVVIQDQEKLKSHIIDCERGFPHRRAAHAARALQSEEPGR